MSSLNPIPRSNRRQDLAALAGQTIFGVSDFKVYDALDVRVRLKPAGSPTFVTLTTGYSVALVAAAPAYCQVTLTVPRSLGDVVRIEGARVPNRTSDCTRGGTIVGALIERDQDLAVVVQQELRRDYDDVIAAVGLFEGLVVAVAAAQAAAEAAATAALAARDDVVSGLSAKAAKGDNNDITSLAALTSTAVLDLLNRAVANLPTSLPAQPGKPWLQDGNIFVS